MATILKGDRIGQSSTDAHLIAFNVEDVQERARAYLAEIQQQAAKIIEDANKRAVEISATAHQVGLESGRKEFDEQVERRAQQISDQRCKTAIASCEATVQQLSGETTSWLTNWRNLTVELASKMAEKLVRRSMKDNEEVLRVWLEEAIIAMRDARELRILVNPDDFAVAGRFLQNLTKMIPQAAQIEVIPDPEISLGGCVVRSMHGFIDQQLETQLKRLVEQLQ
ncbi:MAG: FliH/SctL family protein [Pirellulaceae bacterium]|nr:FliH/SctL family protein [Pirellulaceae bacterium]